MVEGFGGVLTRLTQEQAAYINVEADGPFKPEAYKYQEIVYFICGGVSTATEKHSRL